MFFSKNGLTHFSKYGMVRVIKGVDDADLCFQSRQYDPKGSGFVNEMARLYQFQGKVSFFFCIFLFERKKE